MQMRGKGHLSLSPNVSTPWIFAMENRIDPAPRDAACEVLWAKTRAVRWVNKTVAWPSSPLDGSIVEATRFSYKLLGTGGCDGGGYGCWYYLTPGLGSRIRLGRVIELRDRPHLKQWIRESVSVSRSLWTTARCHIHPFCGAWRALDRGVCAAAVAQGFDTVLVGIGTENGLMPEIILCSGVCMSTPQCYECPAVEYAPDCECSVGSGLSNCNNDSSIPPIPRCGEQNDILVDMHLLYATVGSDLLNLMPLWWALLGICVWFVYHRRRAPAPTPSRIALQEASTL